MKGVTLSLDRDLDRVRKLHHDVFGEHSYFVALEGASEEDLAYGIEAPGGQLAAIVHEKSRTSTRVIPWAPIGRAEPIRPPGDSPARHGRRDGATAVAVLARSMNRGAH